METLSDVRRRRYVAAASVAATVLAGGYILLRPARAPALKPSRVAQPARRAALAAESASAGAQPGLAPQAAYKPLRLDTLKTGEVPPIGETGPVKEPASHEPSGGRAPTPPVLVTGEEAAKTAASAAAAGLKPSASSGDEAAAASGVPGTPGSPGAPASAPPAGTRGPADAAREASAPASAAGGPGRRRSDAGASALTSDPRLLARASGLLEQARDFKVGGDTREFDLTNPASVRQAVAQQIAKESQVEAAVRKKLEELGPSADVEQQRQAVADTLAAHGMPTDEKSITNALGSATTPPALKPKDPPPQAVQAAIDDYTASNRGDTTPNRTVPPIHPSGPPPRGAREAYDKYRDAFREARERFGVQPWDILAILQQETSFGVNIGNTPFTKANAFRTSKNPSAGRADLAGFIWLKAQGWLPDKPAGELPTSPTGAMGPAQFQPATQKSAGRGNPYEWPNQIAYSVPHLLVLNGYKPDDAMAQRKAYSRYYGDGNPNGKYATDVARKAANIRPMVEREQPAVSPEVAAKKK